MNRKEYLELCQKASALPETTMHMKAQIPPDLKVLYNGIQFYPIGYEMTFKQGISQHTAILHDMKAHSVIYADLEKVERYKR